MFRRAFAVSLLAVPMIATAAQFENHGVSNDSPLEIDDDIFDDDDDHEPTAEEKELWESAQLLADEEHAKGDWRTNGYIEQRPHADSDYTILICASTSDKLMDRFFPRVEAAMNNGMGLYSIGQAGQVPGRGEGYNFVTAFIVSSEGLAKNMGYFADMFAENKRIG